MKRAELLAQRRALLVIECALQRVTLVSQLQPSAESSSNWRTFALSAIDGLIEFIPGRLMSAIKIGLNLWKIWKTFSNKESCNVSD